jgi:HSP20 family molecular chaperone IbpA
MAPDVSADAQTLLPSALLRATTCRLACKGGLQMVTEKNHRKHAFMLPASRKATPRELVFKPFVDIFETEKALTLIADMPGVAATDMAVEWRDGRLAIEGRVRPWEGAEESDILVEFEIGRYRREFALPKAVDHDRIDAHCADGTLRLTLPKQETMLPRSINVKTG